MRAAACYRKIGSVPGVCPRSGSRRRVNLRTAAAAAWTRVRTRRPQARRPRRPRRRARRARARTARTRRNRNVASTTTTTCLGRRAITRPQRLQRSPPATPASHTPAPWTTCCSGSARNVNSSRRPPLPLPSPLYRNPPHPPPDTAGENTNTNTNKQINKQTSPPRI